MHINGIEIKADVYTFYFGFDLKRKANEFKYNHTEIQD